MIRREDDTLYFDLREDPEEVTAALQEIFSTTEVGREYLKDFFTQEAWPEHYEAIVSTAERRVGPRANVDTLTGVLSALMQTRRIKPKRPAAEPLVEPAPDTRPKTKDGRPMSDSQLAWREMRIWVEGVNGVGGHSSEECRQRAKTDPAFASFMRTNFARESAPDPRGMLTPAGVSTKPRTQVAGELVDFVSAYNRTPASETKPKAGFVTLAGDPAAGVPSKKIAWPLFQEKLNEAISAGLL